MFKFLRSNAKFFYWIIAATFIAFIFVAWGMDVAGSRGGAARGGTAVGSVNGIEISAQAYDRAVRNAQNSMSQNAPDRTLNANQVALAQEQAWNGLIREVLMTAEIERLGLGITDDEILSIFRDTPPPEILQAYVDETGQPDMQAYYADLGNPNGRINWNQAEAWVRQSVPQRKLMSILTDGVTVSDDAVRELYVGQSGRAVAEYMGVAFADLAKDYEPTDAEIQAYYEAHPGEFHKPARGLCKVASWEIEPAQADFDEVRDLAVEVKQSIEDGEQSFADAAAIYSEDSSASNGGDLGTFDRTRMVDSFTEAAFSLPVGQISDPVQTQFGYHLIEVLEQEMEDDEVARVHARHILLKVEASDATRESIYERARDFHSAVNAANFMELAQADSTCKSLSPRPFNEGRDIPGLPQSAVGSRFVFRAESGQISPRFFTDGHVYVVLAEGLEPEGPRPLEDVKGQVTMSLKRERQRDEARNLLSPAVGRVQMGEVMADVASELGLVHGVTDTISSNANVPDIGYATPFNNVALRTPVGELVPEVETNRGLYALVPQWVKSFDEAEWTERREQLRSVLLRQAQNQALEAWFQAQEDAAEIEDWRDEVMASS